MGYNGKSKALINTYIGASWDIMGYNGKSKALFFGFFFEMISNQTWQAGVSGIQWKICRFNELFQGKILEING